MISKYTLFFIRTSYFRLRLVFLFYFSEFEAEMFLFCSYFLISVVFHTFKKHENLLPQINNAHFIVDLKDNYFMTIYTDKEMNISTLHNYFLRKTKLRLSLFLKCSYFQAENEAGVLIKGVLIKKKSVYQKR